MTSTDRLSWTLEAGIRAGAGTGSGELPAAPVWDGNGVPWCASTCPHVELPSLAEVAKPGARAKCRISGEDTIPMDRLRNAASLCAPCIAAMARILDTPRSKTPIRRDAAGKRFT